MLPLQGVVGWHVLSTVPISCLVVVEYHVLSTVVSTSDFTHIIVQLILILQVGAVNLDSGWSTGYNNFIFDTKKYPNATYVVSALAPHVEDTLV